MKVEIVREGSQSTKKPGNNCQRTECETYSCRREDNNRLGDNREHDLTLITGSDRSHYATTPICFSSEKTVQHANYRDSNYNQIVYEHVPCGEYNETGTSCDSVNSRKTWRLSTLFRVKMTAPVLTLLIVCLLSCSIATATPTSANAHRHGKVAHESHPVSDQPSTASESQDGPEFFLTPDDIQEEIHQEAVNILPERDRDSLTDTSSGNIAREDEGFYDGSENVDTTNGNNQGDYQDQPGRYAANSTGQDYYSKH